MYWNIIIRRENGYWTKCFCYYNIPIGNNKSKHRIPRWVSQMCDSKARTICLFKGFVAIQMSSLTFVTATSPRPYSHYSSPDELLVSENHRIYGASASELWSSHILYLIHIYIYISRSHLDIINTKSYYTFNKIKM